MSPYKLEILLAIYVSPDWRYLTRAEAEAGTEAWHEAIQEFRDNGFLGGHDQGTEKLKVYCEALMSVPMPVQKWAMP